MKRRTFVLLSSVGAVAIGLPSWSCRSPDPSVQKILANPYLLSHICDARTIREIGMAYRSQLNNETNKDQFINLLLTDSMDNKMSDSSAPGSVTEALDRKIKLDFEKENTVVLKGWILSVTEAEQSALFSFFN